MFPPPQEHNVLLHRLNVNENYVRAAIIAASKVCDNKLSEEAFKGFICGCSATEEAKIALISSLGFRLVTQPLPAEAGRLELQTGSL